MNRYAIVPCVVLACVISVGWAGADSEGAESGGPSKDEIAKELANPNTPLTSLKLQIQYFSFDGDLAAADDEDMLKLFLQPTLPFPLESGKTVWVRPGLPLVFGQPVYEARDRLRRGRRDLRDLLLLSRLYDADGERVGSESGLGDITLDVQYGATLENGFLWSLGFSSVFPTAIPDELGSGQWALGPGFQLGRIREKSILGVFVNHQWDIAGSGKSSPELPSLRWADSDEAGISLTTTQLFAVSIPGGGWSFGSMPIMTYNHESEQWSVPLHLTASKTFIINKRPWEFSVDLNYYVERPDAIAPEWMLSFNVAPVVENVFAKWFK